MFRIRFFVILFLSAFISACAAPPRPDNRAEWQDLHTRVISGVSPKEALRAAERVLKLADGEDFRFEYPESGLIARRAWMTYVVVAAVNGQDFWQISAEKVEDGAKIKVRITRQATGSSATPTLNAKGEVSGSAPFSQTMPGREVYWPGPYRLFWARLSYLLGQSKEWVTCSMAESRFPDAFNDADAGVLCGVTTENLRP